MKKIGFLDSGIGGLTVLEAFCKDNNLKTAPNELNKIIKLNEIIYLADLKNLPYGEKSLESLSEILKANLHWFNEQKTDIIVLACNTSSALLNTQIKEQFANLKIFDLISALGEQIEKEYLGLKQIAVFSTMATHRSQAYKNTLQKILPKTQIISIPCPAFVPLIEDELLKNVSNLEQINELALGFLKEYIKVLPFEPEAIVFGCTHYPLLEKAFKQVFKNSLLLNPAKALAWQLQNYKFDLNSHFAAFSTAQEQIFEAKLKALNKVLNCVQYFSNEVQIAKTL